MKIRICPWHKTICSAKISLQSLPSQRAINYSCAMSTTLPWQKRKFSVNDAVLGVKPNPTTPPSPKWALQMQDPSNPNPTSNSQNAHQPPSTSFPHPATSFRGGHHRRAHSEVNFRIPEDLHLVSDPFDAPSASFEEMGSEDDLFCAYIDVEKLGSRPEGDARIDNVGGDLMAERGDGEKSSRPRHRHSNSVDGSSFSRGESLFVDTIEAKKAMAPDKLAELWTLDPKRAKRYGSLYYMHLFRFVS